MDKIFIHDLRVETRIGVYEWERHLPQTIRLDLEIGMPSATAFTSGDLADALDYSAVVARIQAFAKASPPPLLERFTHEVAQLVLTDTFGFGTPPDALEEVFISLHMPTLTPGRVIWQGTQGAVGRTEQGYTTGHDGVGEE